MVSLRACRIYISLLILRTGHCQLHLAGVVPSVLLLPFVFLFALFILNQLMMCKKYTLEHFSSSHLQVSHFLQTMKLMSQIQRSKQRDCNMTSLIFTLWNERGGGCLNTIAINEGFNLIFSLWIGWNKANSKGSWTGRKCGNIVKQVGFSRKFQN